MIPGLGAQILGVCQQGTQRVPHRVQQQRAHHRHVAQPQRIEVMRQREDAMGMATGQQLRLLHGKPALGLERRTLRAGPMPTRVVPDAGHMAVGTRLDMAPEGCGATLHDGARGFPDVGREWMGLLRGWKGVVEDGLERHEGQRCLHTRHTTIAG